MIKVAAIVEAGTLAGNLISCKNVIGKTIDEISNVNTIVISFKDENDVPIVDIEKITFDITNAVTGEITRHEITPTENYPGRFYHYDNTYLPSTVKLEENKIVVGRVYPSNTNVIEQVDDIKLISMTYGDITSDRIIPILQ